VGASNESRHRNSIAIAFVLQIDTALYSCLLNGKEVEVYQRALDNVPQATHKTSGANVLIYRWCWMCALLDFVIGTVAYTYFIDRNKDGGASPEAFDPGKPDSPGVEFFRYQKGFLRVHMMCRGALMVIAHAHIAICVRRSPSQRAAHDKRSVASTIVSYFSSVVEQRYRLLLLLCGAAIAIATVALVYTLLFYGLLQSIGFMQITTVVSPVMVDCVFLPQPMYHPEGWCSALHQSRDAVRLWEEAYSLARLNPVFGNLGGLEQIFSEAWEDATAGQVYMRFGFVPGPHRPGQALLGSNILGMIERFTGDSHYTELLANRSRAVGACQQIPMSSCSSA
jgi:hypothetical protein